MSIGTACCALVFSVLAGDLAVCVPLYIYLYDLLSYVHRLNQWIRGHSQVTTQDYVNAVFAFRMENQGCLKDNVYMMTSIARALFLDGHFAQAIMAFKRVIDN